MRTTCRLCGAPLVHLVADLGRTPLANALVAPARLGEPDTCYPLRALVCEQCFLVQLDTVVSPREIFQEYSYFSSYSDTLLAASAAYAEAMVERLSLGPGSRVIEIASNDGYLLQYFQPFGVEVLGIEPAATVASAARARGIDTLQRFFGRSLACELASRGIRGSLIVANNVLAHVPDPNDFLAGIKLLLEPGGMATFEFHHLLALIAKKQFDTIYHEHFQYFSLSTVCRALASCGLALVDAEEIPAQGGSLRIFARHREEASGPASQTVAAILAREHGAGLNGLDVYTAFARRIACVKRDLRAFLDAAKTAGKRVAAYGAAAKGTTLLNCCGVRADLVEYVVDRSPHKQGLFLPGSRIPIRPPDAVFETRPDYLLVLPWNLRDEITTQMAAVREWGGRFVFPIPELEIVA